MSAGARASRVRVRRRELRSPPAERHEPVEGDRGERGRRHQPDLRLVLRQQRPGRPACHRGRGPEEEVRRGHPETGGHTRPNTANDRGLHDQEAHGADLHRDHQSGRQSCDQRSRQVHELRQSR